MNDKFLTKKFKGADIEDLLDFLHSLDESFEWEGGILFEFSTEESTYFLFWEHSQQNLIFAKCIKNISINNVITYGDVKISHQNVSYEIVSIGTSKETDMNNEEAIKKEIQVL
jgi:hypothetical protein